MAWFGSSSSGSCGPQLPGSAKHGIEHVLGQAARERVLLADVVAADQRAIGIDRHLQTVPESWSRSNSELASHDLVRELPERDDHSNITKGAELAFEERPARVPFEDCRLVLRWCALHRCRDPDAVELESVRSVGRLRLIGVAGPPQRTKQKVTRAIAGEHAAGPVGAVGSRSQADYEDMSVGVAESRDGPGPVVLVTKRRPLLPTDPLAPLDQATARSTIRHIGLEYGQQSSSLGLVRGIHGAQATLTDTMPKASKPTLVLMVRHGQTPTTGSTLPGRASGLHLAESGVAQAENAARRIAGLKSVTAVYASPMETVPSGRRTLTT